MTMGASSRKKGCAYCGELKAIDGGSLVQCKHCNMVAYCGEEHQSYDWKRHKPFCKTVQSHLARCIAEQQNESNIDLQRTECSSGLSDSTENTSESVLTWPSSSGSSSPAPTNTNPKYELPSCGNRSSERTADTASPDIKVIESTESVPLRKETRKRTKQMDYRDVTFKDHTNNLVFTTTLQDHLKALAISGLAINQQQAIALRLKCIAEHVIKSLTEYGWAVVDNFLGPSHLYHVHREMGHLYKRGIFSPGQLMETRSNSNSQEIRSDQIYWYDSNDERSTDAVTIRLLVSMIDTVVLHFNGRVPYSITGRSRAMLAIYPSNGTHYVKHVDNPEKDGRCVTAIYYCNENWNADRYGGCLRLFPQTSAVPFDVDPRGDRLLFLWSDRRMPHEVRPVYSDRYAITIWYFDHDEKMEAIEKKRQRDERERKRNIDRKSLHFSVSSTPVFGSSPPRIKAEMNGAAKPLGFAPQTIFHTSSITSSNSTHNMPSINGIAASSKSHMVALPELRASLPTSS